MKFTAYYVELIFNRILLAIMLPALLLHHSIYQWLFLCAQGVIAVGTDIEYSGAEPNVNASTVRN